MAITVQQAAIDALAAYLSTALADTGATVHGYWPDPETPLAQAVTVIPAGKSEDELLQPVVVSQRAGVDPAHPIFRWRVLERTQPLQLDVWTTSDVDRQTVLAALDSAIHAKHLSGWGPMPGPVLELGGDWTGRADFVFDGVSCPQGPESVQQREFRATIMGETRVALYVDAASAKMATIKLQQILSPSTAVETTTVTAAGVTHS